MKKTEMQTCSRAVYDLLVAFNALPSLAEQEEVLDVIYDAFYGRNVKEALSSEAAKSISSELRNLEEKYDILERTNRELEDENRRVKASNASLQVMNSKKEIKRNNRELLAIIGNVRHRLGDGWDGLFPCGTGDVEAFLDRVDTWGILKGDTWSRFESGHAPEEEADTY